MKPHALSSGEAESYNLVRRFNSVTVACVRFPQLLALFLYILCYLGDSKEPQTIKSFLCYLLKKTEASEHMPHWVCGSGVGTEGRCGESLPRSSLKEKRRRELTSAARCGIRKLLSPHFSIHRISESRLVP